MPIKIPDNLPARQTLKNERINVMDESTSILQDIRPLRILLFNLMPDKIATETQIARVLGISPLQIELTLLRTSSYFSKTTKAEHLTDFYKTFNEIEDECFDGIIVTGAPVEHLDFDEVTYWEEMKQIMNWADQHCFSQFYICWAAQAALYHFHSIPKKTLKSKHFGIYPHNRNDFTHPLTRGFDDLINIPVSRYTEIDEEIIKKRKSLNILLTSAQTGSALVACDHKKQFFMFNHLEYDRNTLKKEYKRNVKNGSDKSIPHNYFPSDDPNNIPDMNWRAHRTLLFLNWINIVYQETPYDVNTLKKAHLNQ